MAQDEIPYMADPALELSRIGTILDKIETFWKNKQPFLESSGYMLRRRYRPQWVASWLAEGRNPYEYEDFYGLPVSTID
jgi:hypothetical protein